MAIQEFKLPDLGEGVAEGELVAWHVEPGEEVEEDQTVAEVETDKALVEIPSPYDGTVAELRAEAGEIVPTGTVIITFEVDDGAPADDAATAETTADADAGGPDGASDAAADEPGGSPADDEAAASEPTDADAGGTGGRSFAAPSVRRLARKLGVDLAAVSGSGPGGRVTETDVRQAADAAAVDGETGSAAADPAAETGGAAEAGGETAPEPADAASAEAGGGDGAGAGTPSAAGRERTLAAPATRRIAHEVDVDIDDVPAVEQREGEAFVTMEAVREYAEAQQAAQEADAAALGDEASAAASGEATASTGDSAGIGAAETAEPTADATAEASTDAGAETSTDAAAEAPDEPEPGDRIPYRGVRRSIGEAMERSKYTAPHVTHMDTVVVEDLVSLREDLKETAAERDARLTFLPFVMKAVVAALKQYPMVNASLDEEAEEIVLHDEYNLGVATATDAGLMVPVVEGADNRGLLELATATTDLVEQARNRDIPLSKLRGGTFTITNLGSVGGEYGTPIINYPEVAILALGAIEKRPVVEDGEVVARETLPISLSVDHRVIDGAEAAQFVNTVMEYLANPRLLLLE